jgi:hypothetical protein
VTASEYALGEERGYTAPDGADEGTIFFHPQPGTYEEQAEHLFSEVIPQAIERNTDLTPGQIAVLYPAAWIGDFVADAAHQHGFSTIRSDTNALYPRSSSLMRWLELCAVWCGDGWRSGTPRFLKLADDGYRIFADVLVSDESRLSFRRNLLSLLWERRDTKISLHQWLQDLRRALISALIAESRTLDDDGAVLDAFIERTGPDGDVSDMTLGVFSGFGEGSDRMNLSTCIVRRGGNSRLSSCSAWMMVESRVKALRRPRLANNEGSFSSASPDRRASSTSCIALRAHRRLCGRFRTVLSRELGRERMARNRSSGPGR